MKKIITIIASILALSVFSACSNTNTDSLSSSNTVNMSSSNSVSENGKATVKITALDSTNKSIEKEVPYMPERIAVLDMAMLDVLTELGVGDRVVGVAGISLDYLKSYEENKDIMNIGTIKEPNMEKLAESNPDVIFIGRRLAKSYEAIEEIAPVVFLNVDPKLGVVESTKKNAAEVAKMFGKEAEVEKLVSDFDARIEKLKEVSKDKTALVGLTTSGSFNLLSNDGRCSLIGVEAGFKNLSDDDTTSTHGNEASFETVVKKAPDYIFVMDRDSAIQTEGAKLAKEIMENELVKKTAAYKNGNIVYLDNPAVWYTAEGGIKALDVMLRDLEKYLIK